MSVDIVVMLMLIAFVFGLILGVFLAVLARPRYPR